MTIIEAIYDQTGSGWYNAGSGSLSLGPVSLIDCECWPPFTGWPINSNNDNLVTAASGGVTYGYYVNSPDQFANGTFSLY